MDTTKFIILYTHTHKDDDYYVDDSSGYDVEHHTLTSGKKTLNQKEVVGIRAVWKEIEEIGSCNADNPPYDSYDVVIVYDAETKEVLPKHYWYDDRDRYNEPEWDDKKEGDEQ